MWGRGSCTVIPLPLEQLIAMIKQRATAQTQDHGACILTASQVRFTLKPYVRSLSV